MSTLELKEQLIEKLISTEDSSILEGVYRLFEMNNEDDVYILTSEEKEKIIESKNQIKKGEFITNENLQTKINLWLNK